MLILILGILVVIIGVCAWLSEITYTVDEMFYVGAVCMVIVFAIVSITTLNTALGLVDSRVIDERIAMYEEENAKIELQIAETVKQYQEYEKGIFTDVAPDDAVMVVAAYPELKSDELVQQQVQIYLANNEKIKELKEEAINVKVKKWLLYFGE